MRTVSVNHLLLLPIELTGDQQLAIKLASELRKHCTRTDQSINGPEIPTNLVELEAICLTNFRPLEPLFLNESKEMITSNLSTTAGLAVNFSLQLLEKFINNHFGDIPCLIEQPQIH